ncbi:hypothetical protein ES705_29961 [subsurface metagenome]
METWLEIMSQYGVAVGVLIIMAFMFATGKILSKKTVDRIEKTYESNLNKTYEVFKGTLAKISEEHTKEVKMITSSFNKQIAQLKEIIKIFKQRNNIK